MGHEPEIQLAVASVDTLAAIIESADDAIIGKRLDGTILSWNSSAERLFGFRAEEIIGQNVMRLIPEGREHEETEIIVQLRRGEQVRHFETQRRHRAGHLVDISLSISPIRDIMGRVVGASKIARDISELVATRASEARTRAALATRSQVNQLMARARSGPAFARDFTATLVDHGHATAALVLQGPPDAPMGVLGSAGLDADHSALALAPQSLQPWVRQSLLQGKRCDVQPWTPADAPSWTAEAQAMALLPFAAGPGAQAGCLVVFNRALSDFDHRQIDLFTALGQDLAYGLENLRREHQFERVFDATKDGFLITNHRGVVLLANPAAERLLGPLRGRELDTLLANVDLDAQALDVQRATMDHDGEQLVVLRDQRTEHALVQAREASAAAEAARRARTELLSRVSHELRQPLTAITGYAELLQRSAVNREPQSSEPLDRILGAARHLNALIGDLLDMSLIEGGHLQVNSEALDAAAALREAMALVSPQADSAGVGLQLRLPAGEQPRLQADAARLRQVLSNLLSNAIKYNRAGGTVWVGAAQQGPQVQLTIADNGLGIAAERLPELFQAFNRLGREHSDIPGSGVGLSLARELVNRMQGQIGVDSQLGLGTTITVSLPAAAPQEAAQQPAGEPAGTVLVVDDDPVVRLLLQAQLARWPAVQVLAAAHGDEALALASQHPPDLLLVDLHLAGGLSGLEVMARLRQASTRAQLPALLLTGSTLAADHQAALQAGAQGVLVKPLEVAHLLPALARLLGRRP